MYNVSVDPVSRRNNQRFFVANGAREGRSANYFCNPLDYTSSWVNTERPFRVFI